MTANEEDRPFDSFDRAMAAVPALDADFSHPEFEQFLARAENFCISSREIETGVAEEFVEGSEFAHFLKVDLDDFEQVRSGLVRSLAAGGDIQFWSVPDEHAPLFPDLFGKLELHLIEQHGRADRASNVRSKR